jgi:peptidoglycan-associated lipoprotein
MRSSAWLAVALMIPLAACSSDDASTAASGGAAGTGAGAGAAGGAGSAPVASSSLGGGGGGGGSGGAGSASGAGQLAQGVPDRVLFGTDRSALSAEAIAILERQAAWLQQNPRITVQVAGNADERGTAEYNLALGQRRAGAARDYLVSRGVQGSRIATISYGKDRPVALGSGEAAWTQNRNAITAPK